MLFSLFSLLSYLDLDAAQTNYLVLTFACLFLLLASLLTQLSSFLKNNENSLTSLSLGLEYKYTNTQYKNLFNDRIKWSVLNDRPTICQLKNLLFWYLSAAFDTIDHSILLKCLEQYVGIKGSALNWFPSGLNGRHFSVPMENLTSSSMCMQCATGIHLRPCLLFPLFLPLANFCIYLLLCRLEQ